MLLLSPLDTWRAPVQTQQMGKQLSGGGLAPKAKPIVWSRIRHWLQLTQSTWGPAASELALDDVGREVSQARHPHLLYPQTVHVHAPIASVQLAILFSASPLNLR